MAELYIGTSGYDYPEWKTAGFYPQNIKRADFLSYYATQFNSLELNGTFYRMPSSTQMQNMVTRSGGKIKFTVKAHQDLTHAQDKSNYLPLLSEFKNALEPLQSSNLLQCVLFQFPEAFHYERDQRVYLDNLLRELKELPVVVEMRNIKWQNDQVYNALKQHKAGWCITDNPALKNLPALDYVVTSGIAYMRFHGRNAKDWYTGNNISRYDYLYNDSELLSFVSPLKKLLGRARILQVFFNNHARAQAARNAKQLELLF